MELFEYINGDKKVSKYETNHLHMYIDDDILFPNTWDMPDESYATFIHEYVHYIQHLTTLFGIRICDMYNRMYVLYRDYIINHDEIHIPLHLWEEDPNLKNFLTYFKSVSGSKDSPWNIDAVDIRLSDIQKAKETRTSINIGCYDFENQKIIEKGFNFGYVCVMEGMAHAIQVLINPNVNHATIPYHAVELVIKEYYPHILNDNKMIASICFCALNWDNPGVGFFDVIDIAKEHQEWNGKQLYQHITRDYSIRYQKKERPRFRLIELFLKNLKINLQKVIGMELEYYNLVIDKCINEASHATSILLDVLYDMDISDKRISFQYLVDNYGYPMIDAKNYTALPMKEDNQGHISPYKETATIYGMELIISRFMETNGKKDCRRFGICSINMHSNPEHCIASEECLFNQWDKKERCVFTEGMQYYRFDQKQFITDN